MRIYYIPSTEKNPMHNYTEHKKGRLISRPCISRAYRTMLTSAIATPETFYASFFVVQLTSTIGTHTDHISAFTSGLRCLCVALLSDRNCHCFLLYDGHLILYAFLKYTRNGIGA